MSSFLWRTQVRAHEVDSQGIVNNAYYLTLIAKSHIG